MKKIILLSAFFGLIALQVRATTFLYDSFNYNTGSLGTAGSPTWVKNGTTADPTVQNVGGLTYPGLQVSGNTLSLQYDGSGVAPLPAGTDGATISSGITNGNLYYSFLMKVTAVQTLGGNGFATAVTSRTVHSWLGWKLLRRQMLLRLAQAQPLF